MGGQKRKAAPPDTRKAAHSGDAARPSKGTKGKRDAATVSRLHLLLYDGLSVTS
jgi:hypothetical protein